MNTNTTRLRRARMAAIVLALAGTLLAACGTSSERGTDRSSTTEGGFNDADVAFAAGMIPHHQQALAMVELTSGRDLDPEVASLAADIRSAQAPEIEQMTEWLTAWDQPVPTASDDGHDMDAGGMPGMMSRTDMTRLEDAADAEFQTLWLELMIEHHQGAVAMARTQQAQGEYRDAVELAEEIEAAQAKEIATMEELLGQP